MYQKNTLSLAIATALFVFVAGCATEKASQQLEQRDDSAQTVDARREIKAAEIGKLDGPAKSKDEEDRGQAGTLATTGQDGYRATGESKPRPVEMPVGEPLVAQSSTVPAVVASSQPARQNGAVAMPYLAPPAPPVAGQYWEPANREKYAKIDDNNVFRVAENAVSTFSIDVDTGSYSNVRRMLNQGQMPPEDAVRAEEFINYFDFGYSPPETRKQPFSVTTEIAPTPWNGQRHLLMIGIKGFEVPKQSIPAANIVFLIDTSGSMETPDKIHLLKQAFKQMVPSLRKQDRVAIVVYAGSAGLVLPPTPGDQHDKITAALDVLSAGGSTNGGAGIELAYATAQQAFIQGGVNRVVLATDGDFNVGTVSTDALTTLVEQKRESGISLTTLGFGQDNYNDELAEQLADVGNGNHFYIDTLQEGHKVLVEEMSSTMMTIAKDVKIQIEFNPTVVEEYRLIGYENRVLQREDFNNDKVDAGEIGAGHDVTALYEIALKGSGGTQIEPLRYASPATSGASGGELAFLKLRYKEPNGDTSTLIEQAIGKRQIGSQASERLRFAAAVAAFADSLRGAEHLANFDLTQIAALARGARGEDRFGYRAELIKLVETAASLRGPQVGKVAISD